MALESSLEKQELRFLLQISSDSGSVAHACDLNFITYLVDVFLAGRFEIVGANAVWYITVTPQMLEPLPMLSCPLTSWQTQVGLFWVNVQSIKV